MAKSFVSKSADVCLDSTGDIPACMAEGLNVSRKHQKHGSIRVLILCMKVLTD